LVNLLDVAQLLGSAGLSTLQPEQLRPQVISSIASFDNGWTGIALAIFGNPYRTPAGTVRSRPRSAS
jgi:hypothetical protein